MWRVGDSGPVRRCPLGHAVRYRGSVPQVILLPSAPCRILASPTTEPGRRGWEWRLGSPRSAPIFFAPNPSRRHLENKPCHPERRTDSLANRSVVEGRHRRAPPPASKGISATTCSARRATPNQSSWSFRVREESALRKQRENDQVIHRVPPVPDSLAPVPCIPLKSRKITTLASAEI